jgi:hypothetical protein
LALATLELAIARKMRREGFALGGAWRKSATRTAYKVVFLLCVPAFFVLTKPAQAQSCQTSSDLSASVRATIESTAQRYFQMAAKGDLAGLKQNADTSLSAGFSGVEAVIKANQAELTGAQATLRPIFLLTVEGEDALPRAEFLCGVFGKSGQTSDSAVFVLNHLLPGKYGVAVLDISGGQEPRTMTLILQQASADWKLAGFYIRAQQAAGHDAQWFAQKARDFKAKGTMHDAWLYYREAIGLASAVDFMSTQVSDKLYDEAATAQPTDVPSDGHTVDLAAGGKTYTLTEMFPISVGNDIDVVVKYQAADVSNTAHAFQENTIVIKALVVKFPELREAFAGVVARAVEPSGHDYGSLLAMKDIK